MATISKYVWIPLVLIVLFLFLPEEMTLLVQGLIFISFVVATFAGFQAVGYLREKKLLLRADRTRAEIITVVAPKDNQVHIREVDKKATWRSAHTDPRVYANGKWEDANEQERESWLAWNQPKIIQGQATQVLQQTVPQVSRFNLLEELKKFERVLVIGVTDTGKTTLIMKLIENKQGKIIALDPHSEKGKWPQRVDVIGGGRKFHLITEALAALEVLMNKRYEQMDSGLKKERSFSPITIVADEWRAAVQHSKEAAESLKSLLNEGRKVNIGMILGSQSERVRALGIEGEGDLKESFAIARLKLNKLTQERRATIDFGEGEVECDFVLQEQAIVTIPAQEQLILQDYQSGTSITAITKKIFGAKAGGNQAAKVKEVLSKYGYVTM